MDDHNEDMLCRSMSPAGFWVRVVASGVDLVTMLFLSFFVSLVGLPDFLELVAFLVIWYFFVAFLHASPWQATLGKKLLGLKVTDGNGDRISLGQSTVRFAAGFVSALIFCVGYMMAAWTKKKQCLHDMIAGTVVMRCVRQHQSDKRLRCIIFSALCWLVLNLILSWEILLRLISSQRQDVTDELGIVMSLGLTSFLIAPLALFSIFLGKIAFVPWWAGSLIPAAISGVITALFLRGHTPALETGLLAAAMAFLGFMIGISAARKDDRLGKGAS
jgi:uncharacterized RDD family membrane protein YckC